ncbi:CHAP domain-containing protein [Kitasatospora sp. NPDC006697]|uniref:CHAP domain-containing protein n=1 Tax=Kitasatospora sp. NPDC006697 TaxID=3364020 RepID=UPI0036C6962E
MSRHTLRRTLGLVTAGALLTPVLALVAGSTAASAATPSDVASLALANVGKGAGSCSTVNSSNNSLGGTAFNGSCVPEYWCADFAKWVWQNSGLNTTGIDAAAASFVSAASSNGSTVHTSRSYVPQLGDAAVYGTHHVGIVTAVNSDGSIQTTNGDFSGESGISEAHFSVTSRVVNVSIPASQVPVGTLQTAVGSDMTITAYVTPSGYSAPTPPPTPTPSVANGQVASVVINGTAHIFQVTSDGHIRMNDGYYPSGGWRGWVPLDGSGVVGLSAAAVGNTVHLFAVMSDGTLRETVGDYTTATWGGWHVVPGSNVAQLSAVTVAGKVRLYATLNDANGSPRSADLDPATDTLSTGWYDLTGGGVKQLVGTAVGDTVRLFAVTGDGLLHENDGNYDAGTWSGWNNVGGSQISTLAAATTGTTVHLYAGTTDGSFHSVDSTGNGQWSGWATQSGSLVDQLNALGDGQTVHLYAHTTDGLTHSEDANYSTSTWTNWYSL